MMARDRDYRGPERRDGYDNGTLAGLPVWARAISVLGAVGCVCLFLGFLIYTGAKSIPELQKELSALIESNHMLEKSLQEHQREAERQSRISVQVCANLARMLKDDVREQRCYEQ